MRDPIYKKKTAEIDMRPCPRKIKNCVRCKARLNILKKEIRHYYDLCECGCIRGHHVRGNDINYTGLKCMDCKPCNYFLSTKLSIER